MDLNNFIESIYDYVTIREMADGEFYYWPKNDQHCWIGLNKAKS